MLPARAFERLGNKVSASQGGVAAVPRAGDDRLAGRAGVIQAGAGSSANLVTYSTANAGLLGLTRSLARELGPYGICVNTVMPGLIQVEAENAPPRPSIGPARRTRSSARASLAVDGPKTSRP
ncbi:SDR family oxidoreductase [Streptomyces sp. NPDC048387]|uniref:SDR family oxidoreductase n=1 Tax=Streptomyces sp. NPDC048387 TaxID=3365542 RepID=UPI00371324E6